MLVVHRLIAGRRERVSEKVVRAPPPEGREEPQAIAPNRTAERAVHVVDALHAVLLLEPEIDEILREVVGLHVLVRARREGGAVKRVAAVVRNHVDLYPAHGRFSGQRAGLVADFLHQAVVEVEAGLIAAEADVLNLDAVDHEHVVVVRRPVNLQRRLLHDLGAADIRRLRGHARNQLSHGERILAGGNRIELLARHHRLRHGAVNVDERRRTGNGHRFLELADRELGVDRGGERRRQRDALALDGAEAGQAKRHGVLAGPEIDNPVAAGVVGDGGACSLDQRRAGSLHGDARQHGAGRIPDNSGDGALRVGWRGHREQSHDQQHTSDEPGHFVLLLNLASLGCRPVRVNTSHLTCQHF